MPKIEGTPKLQKFPDSQSMFKIRRILSRRGANIFGMVLKSVPSSKMSTTFATGRDTSSEICQIICFEWACAMSMSEGEMPPQCGNVVICESTDGANMGGRTVVLGEVDLALQLVNLCEVMCDDIKVRNSVKQQNVIITYQRKPLSFMLCGQDKLSVQAPKRIRDAELFKKFYM